MSPVGDCVVVGAALVCSSAIAGASPLGVEHPVMVVASAIKRTIVELALTALARLVGNGDVEITVQSAFPWYRFEPNRREWFPTS